MHAGRHFRSERNRFIVRRMSHLHRVLFVAAFAWLSGCNCVSDSCTTTSDCGNGFVCSGGVCQASNGPGDASVDAGTTDGGHMSMIDAGQATLTSISVDPATATLQSVNGGTPSQAFTVTATFSDGRSQVVPDADFTVDRYEIGSVGPIGGPFTATGLVGGLATVTVSVTVGAATRTATAAVEVVLEQTLGPPNMPSDVPGHFSGTAASDPARTADVVYPLDGVVFPQNVAPADVQWLNGEVGDWFRVRFTKNDAIVTSFVQEDGNHHLVIDTQAWRSLAQTNPSSPATLEVQRWISATSELIAGTPRTVTFAPAALTGSIYYWDIGRGRIVRIDDGTTNRTEFMPNPPPGVDNSRCVGCHSVSPSGRYMAGRLGGGDNIGGIYDLTTDLTGDPTPSVWPISNTVPETTRWWFSSWSPDEKRLVMTQNETSANSMAFMDPFTGALVPVANIPAVRVTHPAWSPDGTKIAYVALPGAGGWGGDSNQGDIGIVPVTGPDTLGAAVTVHSGASLAGETPSGNADAYPTWSPDSQWLAFAHGDNNRSETGHSALYLMKPDGTELRRLDRASGGPTADLSFQPRFSPFKAGGFYWMTFLSRRDYGNDKVGTRGLGRQQIWVSAISENPGASGDPSQTAYWLPGQSTGSQNIAAYWAPRACRQAGVECSVGQECCSGTCAMGTGGTLTCSPPPPERCRRENETCGGSGDCCPGLNLKCEQNVCVLDIG